MLSFKRIEETEAAGIEPASRGTSMKASTCVSDNLVLAAIDPYRQGSLAASQERFLVAGVPSSDPQRAGFGGQRSSPSGWDLKARATDC
jgi:hypothetical protein